MSNPDFRKMTDQELIQIRNGTQGWHPNSSGAIAELVRRESNSRFWRRDIVAWIALIISILALWVAMTKN